MTITKEEYDFLVANYGEAMTIPAQYLNIPDDIAIKTIRILQKLPDDQFGLRAARRILTRSRGSYDAQQVEGILVD